MSKTKAQTMTVRLPVEIGQALTKIRESNNLSTIGSALKYWIEQQNNEKIESKLNQLETAIREIGQVRQLEQASIILNSNMIAMILKAVTPEKITDNPEVQKHLDDTIKYIENNQTTINNFVKAGLEQGKKLQKKYPQKDEKTEANRINR
ncbi:hypothetical protein ES705_22259 [subsurface metagenome]